MTSPMPDLPEHFPMSVTVDGRGPAVGAEIAAWECWCRDRAQCEVFIDAIYKIHWDQFGAEQ